MCQVYYWQLCTSPLTTIEHPYRTYCFGVLLLDLERRWSLLRLLLRSRLRLLRRRSRLLLLLRRRSLERDLRRRSRDFERDLLLRSRSLERDRDFFLRSLDLLLFLRSRKIGRNWFSYGVVDVWNEWNGLSNQAKSIGSSKPRLDKTVDGDDK
ncbi:hypothetical protein E2C01_058573 [Portunus trituberculatus]|uniref:Uncharacterized protein n=1 Tax=Portunus trituberculatus TaxID=210409 RepID=A0A5B7H527_PORTR|nr:hypothetical protein [Portunus trituberculatus]